MINTLNKMIKSKFLELNRASAVPGIDTGDLSVLAYCKQVDI
jgi:hypothetical protein